MNKDNNPANGENGVLPPAAVCVCPGCPNQPSSDVRQSWPDSPNLQTQYQTLKK